MYTVSTSSELWGKIYKVHINDKWQHILDAYGFRTPSGMTACWKSIVEDYFGGDVTVNECSSGQGYGTVSFRSEEAAVAWLLGA